MNRRQISYITAVVLALVTLICSQLLTPVTAQDTAGITLTDSQVSINFPYSMTFSATIDNNTPINDVRLRYSVEQMSFADVVVEGYVPITTGLSVQASYTLDMRKFGGFPPGTHLQYWWAVKTDSDSYWESQPVSYQVTDERYDWQTLNEGKIKLNWYNGDESFARQLMDRAQESLQQLSEETGVAPDRQIEIFIYNGSSDLQGSMIYPSEWTGGVSFYQFNIIAIGITPGNLEWGLTAMTHELTHNVIGQAVFNPYSDLPVWLNEGLAMYFQGPFTDQFSVPLAAAIRSDSLISVRSICSPFSAYADKAVLSYAESYALMDYLLETYGTDEVHALLMAFKAGNTYDGAFEQVLGLNMEQLDQEWLPWVKNNYSD